ncbi:hypothetical protein QQG74_20395 [Micromonospora sp. FIMYZ51]|uniref:hypothetical protein n=1 Tax=Micromonospora sp. FIMYZ51 TaxID=3051832 RepID=UPI00311E4209
MNLQRQVGNRAVTALLSGSRTRTPPVWRLPTTAVGAEVTTALRVEDRPVTTSGPEVIAADPPLVQRHVGLAKKKTAKAYATSTAKAFRHPGVSPKSFDDVLKAQQLALDEALQKHQIPPTTLVAVQQGANGVRAGFVRKDWRIEVNQDAFPEPIDATKVKKLAATVYHEARHAEQWFNMIRHVVLRLRDEKGFQGDDPASVQKEIAAPLPIISRAIDSLSDSNWMRSTGTAKPIRKAELRWAGDLFDATIETANTAFKGHPRLALKAAEQAPVHLAQVYTELLRQKERLGEVRSRGEVPAEPLDTNHWPASAEQAVDDLWQLLAKALEASPSGTPGGPLHATIKEANDNYLRSYGDLLARRLDATEKEHAQAYEKYRNLPIEADAFVTQGRVEKFLDKELK